MSARNSCFKIYFTACVHIAMYYFFEHQSVSFIVLKEEGGYAATCSCLAKWHCAQCLFSECSHFFAQSIGAVLVENLSR